MGRDAYPAMKVAEQNQKHERKVTPPKETSSSLSLVYIDIGNMKTFLSGTFHGVAHKYFQEYLNEFCFRFNRRFWKAEIPSRPLNDCVPHGPVID